MPPVIIADASCLILLEKIGELHLLHQLYGYLLVTDVVAAEYGLAQAVGIPQTRLSEILKRKRRITADTALRLGRYFGNSPKFWLGLQDDYDLE